MSDLIKTFDQDGFTVKVFKVEDPEDSSDYLGQYTDAPTVFPAWDRAKNRVLWDAADYRHHKAEKDYWDPRTYRYVHNFQDTEGVDRAEAEKYIRQNVARLDDYGQGWTFVGVVAKVYRAGVKLGEASVWGVESDSDAAHFDELAGDEASEALDTARATLDKLCKVSA